MNYARYSAIISPTWTTRYAKCHKSFMKNVRIISNNFFDSLDQIRITVVNDFWNYYCCNCSC